MFEIVYLPLSQVSEWKRLDGCLCSARFVYLINTLFRSCKLSPLYDFNVFESWFVVKYLVANFSLIFIMPIMPEKDYILWCPSRSVVVSVCWILWYCAKVLLVVVYLNVMYLVILCALVMWLYECTIPHYSLKL